MAEGEAELMKKLERWSPADLRGLFFYVLGHISVSPGWTYFREAALDGIGSLGPSRGSGEETTVGQEDMHEQAAQHLRETEPGSGFNPGAQEEGQ